MVADGQIVEWRAMEGLYLYQEIHTLDYRARHLAAHIGVITRRAEELLGKEFSIELEAEEREEDEFYLEDLIGFRATILEMGTERTFTGEVADYIDSEINPLFELDIEGREVLVPAVDEMIGGIDFEAEKIKFILPEGLID